MEGVGRSAASEKDAEGEDNVNGLAGRRKFISYLCFLPNLRYNAYVCSAR